MTTSYQGVPIREQTVSVSGCPIDVDALVSADAGAAVLAAAIAESE